LIKIIIKEENFKWHLEAFASELFTFSSMQFVPIFRPSGSKQRKKYNLKITDALMVI